jgi:hypothetical protein
MTSPSFMGAEDMMFSGDWPGHLQRTVEALIGQNVTLCVLCVFARNGV